MKKSRLGFIDIARAFAIIFIVFGHTIVHNQNSYLLYQFLYSFHVVLFFIISGYIYQDNQTIKEFTKKRFFSLMIPYFIFSILFLIPYFIFGINVKEAMGANGSTNLVPLFKEIIYGVGANGSLKQNTSLWFLPALFTTEVLYKLLNSLSLYKERKPITKLLFLTMISFIGTKIPFIMPWGLNTAITLLVFYELGNQLKEKNILQFISNHIFLEELVRLLVIISYFIYNKNITISCVDYKYGNYFIFLFTSISISLYILFISYKINHLSLLQLIGKNTLGILIFHKLFILLFQTKISFTKTILTTGNIISCIIVSLVITCISIFISMTIGRIIIKYFPYLYGKKKRRPKRI